MTGIRQIYHSLEIKISLKVSTSLCKYKNTCPRELPDVGEEKTMLNNENC
jgi:hypothetical protein